MTPITSSGTEITGPILGQNEDDLGRAREAAEWAAANSLLALAHDLSIDGSEAQGAFDVLVFCNAPVAFGAQSAIADAATALMSQVLPGSRDPVRAAVGAGSLVRNSTVVVKATYLLSSSSTPN